MPSAPDPRWIILFESGEYMLMGRHRQPSVDELREMEARMTERSVRGWLAVMDRSEYAPGEPEFVMIKAIGDPLASFEDAVINFRSRIASQLPD